MAMRQFSVLLLIILAVSTCTVPQKTGKVTIGNTLEEAADSTRYELIILDPGFDSWMIINSRPVWFYSQSWLETWNRQYVAAWNSKVMSGRTGRYFETYIDYQYHKDYGLELNYKLYYYFQYVENGLKIPILPEGMKPQGR
jgi:hypothetical protein